MRHEQTTPSSHTIPKGLEPRVFVGIDPGLDKHGVVAVLPGSPYRLARREIPNTIHGMEFLAQLLTRWRDQADGRLMIGIEEASAFGEALECYLSQARFLIAQPDLARAPARQATDNDPHGRSHRRLRQLSRRHQRWTKDHTAVTNELHAVLRMAWLGHYQGFFSRIAGAAALTLWQSYPTLADSLTSSTPCSNTTDATM